MNKNETLKRMLDERVVAVVRMSDRQKVGCVIDALARGGIGCIEITMTVPGAIDVIAERASAAGEGIVLGAGTVTDAVAAQSAVRAGARFIVSPIFDSSIVRMCQKLDVVCVPGCYSPSEIFSAWGAGADIVKVFPARNLGPKYLKDLSGPFPNIRLMPTGGVSVDNAAEWIAAGAAAVGIGGELVDKKAVAEGRFDVLTAKAETLLANIRRATAA